MIRTIVTFLALLPSLMPPGTCACRCVSCGTQHEGRNGSVLESAESEHVGCNCSRCGTSSCDAEFELHAATTCQHSHGDADPCRGPIQHEKNCPKLSATIAKSALASSTIAVVAIHEFSTLLVAPTVRNLLQFTSRVATAIDSTPLFVSQCSYLI